MRLLALVSKDARIVLRNRALLVALLAYPILLAVVLGSAFQEPPSTLELAIVDEDRTGQQVDVAGTQLGVDDLLRAAEDFANIRQLPTEDAATRALRRGTVDAVLIVPNGFIRDLATLGSNATLRLIVDPSDPVRAGVAQSAVEGAVDAFVREIVRKKIDDVLDLLTLTQEGGTTRVLFVDVEVLGIERAREHLMEVRQNLPQGGPDQRKVDEVIGFLDFTSSVLGNSERYLVTTALPLHLRTQGLVAQTTSVASVALPGALVLGVFWTGALAAALLVARERETGAARRLAAAPGGRAPWLASKTIVALLAALVPGAIVLVIGIVVLGATVASPVMTLVVLVLASLAAASLGAFAAGVARASAGAALLAVLALLPMLLLGGLFYPVAYMPPAAQVVARALPVTMATDALRGAMLRGSSVFELAPALGGLAFMALLLGGATIWLTRRTA